jgi:hypothetical protein
VANTFNELEQAGRIAGRLAGFIADPKIGGLAITPTVGSAGTTMQGSTGWGFESLSDTLPVIVAEGRQKRPIYASLVRFDAERIEFLAEIAMHALYRILADRAFYARGSGPIFPAEVAGIVDLARHAPVHSTEIRIDLE